MFVRQTQRSQQETHKSTLVRKPGIPDARRAREAIVCLKKGGRALDDDRSQEGGGAGS